MHMFLSTIITIVRSIRHYTYRSAINNHHSQRQSTALSLIALFVVLALTDSSNSSAGNENSRSEDRHNISSEEPVDATSVVVIARIRNKIYQLYVDKTICLLLFIIHSLAPPPQSEKRGTCAVRPTSFHPKTLHQCLTKRKPQPQAYPLPP